MATHFDSLEPPDPEKFEILQIQDGGGRYLEKSKNRHISAAVWTISTKFDTVMQFRPCADANWDSSEELKSQT